MTLSILHLSQGPEEFDSGGRTFALEVFPGPELQTGDPFFLRYLILCRDSADLHEESVSDS